MLLRNRESLKLPQQIPIFPGTLCCLNCSGKCWRDWQRSRDLSGAWTWMQGSTILMLCLEKIKNNHCTKPAQAIHWGFMHYKSLKNSTQNILPSLTLLLWTVCTSSLINSADITLLNLSLYILKTNSHWQIHWDCGSPNTLHTHLERTHNTTGNSPCRASWSPPAAASSLLLDFPAGHGSSQLQPPQVSQALLHPLMLDLKTWNKGLVLLL